MKQWWQDAPQRTRFGFLIGVLVIVLVMGYALFWVFRDDYQVLFADLNEQDAAAMVKELDKLKTPYKLANGGASILVPGEVVYQTRLKLMGQNIPLQGGVGFEIFNDSDFGMTEFAQKVNYQRALQGELTRTIMGFEEVKYARVHIVMAESGLFKKNKVKPKASVTLIMKPDATLRPEQVLGIQRLVAASVPEIEPSAVTVLDQQGIALSRNPRGAHGANGVLDLPGMSDSLTQQLEIKKAAEVNMTHKLAAVLDRALGPNQAIVSVDISINYDQVSVTKEEVLGSSEKGGHVTGVVTRSRSSSRGQPLPTHQPKVLRSDGSNTEIQPMESATTEIDYQTGRRIEQVISTPGSIRRISVGILVPTYQAEEKLNKIREVLQMAAGINPARGDALIVYSLDQVIDQSTKIDSGLVSTLPPGSDAVAAIPNRGSPNPRQAMNDGVSRNAIYILATLLLIVAALLIYRSRVKRGTSRRPNMNPVEREQLLRDIQSWLNKPVNPEVSKGAP